MTRIKINFCPNLTYNFDPYFDWHLEACPFDFDPCTFKACHRFQKKISVIYCPISPGWLGSTLQLFVWRNRRLLVALRVLLPVRLRQRFGRQNFDFRWNWSTNVRPAKWNWSIRNGIRTHDFKMLQKEILVFRTSSFTIVFETKKLVNNVSVGFHENVLTSTWLNI